MLGAALGNEQNLKGQRKWYLWNQLPSWIILGLYLTFRILEVLSCFVHLGPWWFRNVISSLKFWAKWCVYVHFSQERVNSFHKIFESVHDSKKIKKHCIKRVVTELWPNCKYNLKTKKIGFLIPELLRLNSNMENNHFCGWHFSLCTLYILSGLITS